MHLYNLRSTNFRAWAIFNNAVLNEARLRMIHGYNKAHWVGVDMRNINFAGAYLMRRFLVNQNYSEEFRRTRCWEVCSPY